MDVPASAEKDRISGTPHDSTEFMRRQTCFAGNRLQEERVKAVFR